MPEARLLEQESILFLLGHASRVGTGREAERASELREILTDAYSRAADASSPSANPSGESPAPAETEHSRFGDGGKSGDDPQPLTPSESAKGTFDEDLATAEQAVQNQSEPTKVDEAKPELSPPEQASPSQEIALPSETGQQQPDPEIDQPAKVDPPAPESLAPDTPAA